MVVSDSSRPESGQGISPSSRSGPGSESSASSGSAPAGDSSGGGSSSRRVAWSPLRIVAGVLGVAVVALLLYSAKVHSDRGRGVLPDRDGIASSGPRADVPAILGRAPDFELTERSGRTVRASDLNGTVWVADFVFTRCLGPCPTMTANMARLQDMLADVPRARLVSFSVDPEYDRPKVLRAYADKFGADADRWWFLTGSLDEMERVQVRGFKLGQVDDPIHHSNRFVLIDGDGAIRGYFDLGEPGAVEALAGRVRRLARSLGPGR